MVQNAFWRRVMQFKKLVLVSSIVLSTTVAYASFYINPTPLGSGKSYTLTGCVGQTSVSSGAAAMCNNTSFPASITLTNTSNQKSCSLNVQSSSSATGSCQIDTPVTGSTFVINGGMSSGPAPTPTPSPSPSPSPTPSPTHTPSAAQTALYQNLYGSASSNSNGAYGTDYTPSHFGYFVLKNNILQDEDSRDMKIGQNQVVDMKQVKAAGFSLIRAYMLDTPSWEIYLQQAKDNGLNVVYQVGLCQDVPSNISGSYTGSVPAGECVKNGMQDAGMSFSSVLTAQEQQLKDILSNTTAKANFKNQVKMVFVGNEDLFTVPTQYGVSADTTNADDLINAMKSIRTILDNNGLNNIPITTSIQADVLMASQLKSRQDLVNSIKSSDVNPSGDQASLAINVYPSQWGVPATCAVQGGCTGNNANLMTPNVYSENNNPAGYEGTSQYHTIDYYITQLESKYSLPIMIAETGWPTSGSGSEVSGYVYQGSYTVGQAETFYPALYSYVKKNKIPLLTFEMYDQPGKVPVQYGTANTNPEVHYGLFQHNNKLKDKQHSVDAVKLLPPTSTITDSSQNVKYDSDQLAYIVLTGITEGQTFFPNQVTVKLTRPGYGTVINQTYQPYFDQNGDPVWPQLLVQVDDTLQINVNGKICTATVASTPYLDSTLSPSGHAHQDATYSIFTASGSATQTECNGLQENISSSTSDANLFGLNLLATNTMPEVYAIPGTTASNGYEITVGGTEKTSEYSAGKKYIFNNIAVGTQATVKHGSSCTATNTVEADGKWQNPGPGNCETNWTNANSSGQPVPSIWLP